MNGVRYKIRRDLVDLQLRQLVRRLSPYRNKPFGLNFKESSTCREAITGQRHLHPT
jgi:hypothetical protein